MDPPRSSSSDTWHRPQNFRVVFHFKNQLVLHWVQKISSTLINSQHSEHLGLYGRYLVLWVEDPPMFRIAPCGMEWCSCRLQNGACMDLAWTTASSRSSDGSAKFEERVSIVGCTSALPSSTIFLKIHFFMGDCVWSAKMFRSIASIKVTPKPSLWEDPESVHFYNFWGSSSCCQRCIM